MEIDVFTFVAQVFNFGVLVYLLRRFLYRPIQAAMKHREETIAGRLEDARVQKQAAEELAEQYRNQLRELDDTREAMLAEARANADRLTLHLADELKSRMSEREKEWRSSQDRKAAQELRDFRGSVRQEIVATIRTALSDLADVELERRMAEMFIERIVALDDDEIRELVGDEDRPILNVVTSFALADDQREAIGARIRERFGGEPRLSFDVDDSRVAGVELRCQGHRLGWSVGDYLETLDDAVREHLEQLTQERGDVATPPV